MPDSQPIQHVSKVPPYQIVRRRGRRAARRRSACRPTGCSAQAAQEPWRTGTADVHPWRVVVASVHLVFRALCVQAKKAAKAVAAAQSPASSLDIVNVDPVDADSLPPVSAAAAPDMVAEAEVVAAVVAPVVEAAAEEAPVVEAAAEEAAVVEEPKRVTFNIDEEAVMSLAAHKKANRSKKRALAAASAASAPAAEEDDGEAAEEHASLDDMECMSSAAARKKSPKASKSKEVDRTKVDFVSFPTPTLNGTLKSPLDERKTTVAHEFGEEIGLTQKVSKATQQANAFKSCSPGVVIDDNIIAHFPTAAELKTVYGDDVTRATIAAEWSKAASGVYKNVVSLTATSTINGTTIVVGVFVSSNCVAVKVTGGAQDFQLIAVLGHAVAQPAFFGTEMHIGNKYTACLFTHAMYLIERHSMNGKHKTLGFSFNGSFAAIDSHFAFYATMNKRDARAKVFKSAVKLHVVDMNNVLAQKYEKPCAGFSEVIDLSIDDEVKQEPKRARVGGDDDDEVEDEEGDDDFSGWTASKTAYVADVYNKAFAK